MTTKQITRIKRAAEALSEIGWHIFPVASVWEGVCMCGKDACSSPGKHPLRAGWQKEATDDLQTVTEWFREPGLNIGLSCGASGLVVVDIDPRHGGEQWLDERIEQWGNEWLDTPQALTGGGGQHLFFTAPSGRTVRNSAGEVAPGVDIRGEGGLVVLPPSRHESGGVYEWEEGFAPWEVEPKELPTWLIEEVVSGSKNSYPKKRSRRLPNSGLTHIPEGARNQTLFGAARKLHLAGFHADDVLAAVSAVNTQNAEPPLSDEEILRLVGSATSGARSDHRSPIKLLTVDEIRCLPAPEWLVGCFLPRNAVALLSGPPGVGKSFVATSLALSVATGIDWLGRRVEPGEVLYFALEGMAGYKGRLEAWLDHHDLDWADATNFRLIQATPGLTEPETANELLAAIEADNFSPQPIIIDTLARAIAGADENSAADMSQLVHTLDVVREHTNATVLIIHHPPKDGSSPYRGSSALGGAVDTSISVKGRQGGQIIMVCDKQKDGSPFSTFSAALFPEGNSCVLVGGEEYTALDAPLSTKQEEIVQQFVGLYLSTGEPVRFKALKPLASSRTVSGTLKRLVADGRAAKEGADGYTPSDGLIERYSSEEEMSCAA